MKQYMDFVSGKPPSVTPRAGVWIETCYMFLMYRRIIPSPPVRGCGLKPVDTCGTNIPCSHPPCGGVD